MPLITKNKWERDFCNRPTTFLDSIWNCYYDTTFGTVKSDYTTVYPFYQSRAYNLSAVNHIKFW